MPFGLGIWEIAILAGILVLLFGAKGASGAAKSLGRSVREVQDAVKDVDPRRMFDPDDEKDAKATKAAAPAPARIVDAEPAVPVPPVTPPAVAVPAEPATADAPRRDAD